MFFTNNVWPIMYWLEKGLMAPGNNTYSLRYPKFLLDVFNPKIKLESPPSLSRQVIYGLDVRRCISWMQIKQWKHCVYQKNTCYMATLKMQYGMRDYWLLCITKESLCCREQRKSKGGNSFLSCNQTINDWSALRKREICWCINCNILSQTE